MKPKGQINCLSGKIHLALLAVITIASPSAFARDILCPEHIPIHYNHPEHIEDSEHNSWVPAVASQSTQMDFQDKQVSGGALLCSYSLASSRPFATIRLTLPSGVNCTAAGGRTFHCTGKGK